MPKNGTSAFTGGNNPGANFIVTGSCPSETDVAVATWRESLGVPGGEPVFSATLGYPRAGCFSTRTGSCWEG